MSLKSIFSLLFCGLCSVFFFAQTLMSGIVLNPDNQPISNVKVFVNNTSIETLTDEKGNFTLKVPVNFNYITIFSPFYVLKNIKVTSQFTKINLTIEEDSELQTVHIQSPTDKNWEYNFLEFKKLLLGTSKNAKDCEISEPKKTLKFYVDNTQQTFKVKAKYPIQITNKALGYRISYILKEFSIDYKTQLVTFSGYTTFSELTGSKSKQKKWNKNRMETYNGSIQHFISALSRNQVYEEKFYLRSFKRVENPEYMDDLQRKELLQSFKGKLDFNNLPDSITRRFQAPKFIHVLIKDSVQYNELVQKNDYGTFLHFENYLQVIYENEAESIEFINQNSLGSSTLRKPKPIQTSAIYLTTDAVEIFPNGYYSPTHGILLEQYFAFEKVADMLPLDYDVSASN